MFVYMLFCRCNRKMLYRIVKSLSVNIIIGEQGGDLVKPDYNRECLKLGMKKNTPTCTYLPLLRSSEEGW